MSDISIQNYAISNKLDQKKAGLPPLRTDLVLKSTTKDEDGSPNWVIHDPIAGKYTKLGWQEYEILSRWQLGDTVKIASAISRESNLNVTPSQVEQFASYLLRSGMLRADWRALASLGDARQAIIDQNTSAIMTSQVLFPKFPIFRPQRFLDLTYPYVAPFFTKGFLSLTVAVFFIAFFLVSRQWNEFASTFSFLFSVEGVVATICALILSKCLHELAHAYVSKKYGVRVPSMGIAFLVFFPVLFTETSDAWMIPERRSRIAIAAAGMIAEMALAAFALLAWSLLDDGPIRSACFVLASTVWVMSLLINLNPLVRFDGYFILSESLRVENLSTRAASLGQWTLLKYWTGHKLADPEPHTNRRGRFWLHIYFAATIIYRLFLYIAIGGTFYYLFPKVVAIPAIIMILVVFISRPVLSLAKKASDLAAEKGQLGFRLRSGVLIAMVLAIMFIPFRTSYTAAAIVSPGEVREVFVPEPAQIVSLNVKIGDVVKSGDVLAELASPELSALVQRTNVRANSLELFLQRQKTSEAYRESQEVQLEQLFQVQAERNGYLERIDSLKLKSEIDGTVISVLIDARKGRWVDNKSAFVTVATNSDLRVDAFFDETEISKVPIGSTGILMIDGLPDIEFDVVLERIAPTGQDVLLNPLLASVHGGPIAVRADKSGKLIPERGIYLAGFFVDGPSPFETLSLREIRGAIRVKANSSSFASRAYGKLSSIILRETGLQLPTASIR